MKIIKNIFYKSNNETNIIDLNPTNEFDKNSQCEKCGVKFDSQEDFQYCPYCGRKIKK